MQFSRTARAGVRELWTAVFGEPPIIEVDPRLMLDVLVKSLPVETYSVILRDGVAPPLAEGAYRLAERNECAGQPQVAGPDEAVEVQDLTARSPACSPLAESVSDRS